MIVCDIINEITISAIISVLKVAKEVLFSTAVAEQSTKSGQNCSICAQRDAQ
jgi:hypothetical protein